MSTNDLEVEPLTPALGAIVHGLDLREPLDEEKFDSLRAALLTHQVIFLRDQPLTDEQHLDLARRFGQPSLYPVLEILGQQPPETIEDGPDSPPKADYWHADVTWQPAPPRLAILSTQLIPALGGDTMWASMTAAWDALSEPLQAFLETLDGHHDVADDFFQRVEDALGREKADLVRRELHAGADHPLVIRHPETNRKSLYFGGIFLQSIQGLHPTESRALIDFLWAHVDRPEFVLRWHWKTHDLALWDERCTLHRAIGDHFPARRIVRRCTVVSETQPTAWAARRA